jgi:hypothetical protein
VRGIDVYVVAVGTGQALAIKRSDKYRIKQKLKTTLIVAVAFTRQWHQGEEMQQGERFHNGAQT